MGVQEAGLTLEGLANRLEALERENTELRDEVTALRASGTRRDKLAEKRGSETHLEGEPVAVLEGRVSRRSLLSKAGAAAVAAMAAGTLLYPRQAKADHHSTDIVDADFIITHRLSAYTAGDSTFAGSVAVNAITTSDNAAAVLGKNEASGPGVQGNSSGGPGVEGIANAITGTGVEGRATGSLGYGVKGTGFSGVWGESSHADGRGVMGINPNGTGVKGQGNTGVLGVGFDDRQAGVKGEGPTGVWGKSSRSNFAAVYGQHTGTTGMGVLGIGTGSDAGVAGENPNATGIGTYGECGGGTGVKGVSASGYAGVFEGGKAQLKLKPGARAGKPTTGTHLKGEIYMDSAGTLFVCTANTTSTTAAKWRKLSTTAV